MVYKILIKNEFGEIKEIIANNNDNLLNILKINNFNIQNSCSGKGKCGKCRVKVINKNISCSSQDLKYISKEKLEEGYRLSCTLKVNCDLEIIIPQNNEDMEVFVESSKHNLEVNPIIQVDKVSIDKPSLKDQRSIYKRLKDSINIDNLEIDINYLNDVENILKDKDYNVSLVTYKNKLLDIKEKDELNNVFGLAIDIGTTTIAMYIMNLATGEEVDVVSQVNRQRNYGTDIISRINFTIENNEGLRILQRCIVTQLNDMIQILCENNDIKYENIYNAVIAGNTTIIHLLLGLSCKNIAIAPHIPITTEEINIHADELNITINGIITIMPGIASYVGSDITAGIISSNMINNDRYSLLLDLGTNGEMVVGNNNKIISCSTAAGPAFEGANIKHGIGGVKGAIFKVDLGKNKIYETIGNSRPIGICGSGVLDSVSQLLKYNIIDETGKLYDKDKINNYRLKLKLGNNNQKEFILAQSDDKEFISITQRDIREVQLAKAAIRAGINILLDEANLQPDDIEHLYIGGGFGNFMNVESCLKIGMIPKELKGKIISIGNCAGLGAKKYLLSQNIRKVANEITNKTIYIELSKRQDFQEYFIDCIPFE